MNNSSVQLTVSFLGKELFFVITTKSFNKLINVPPAGMIGRTYRSFVPNAETHTGDSNVIHARILICETKAITIYRTSLPVSTEDSSKSRVVGKMRRKRAQT